MDFFPYKLYIEVSEMTEEKMGTVTDIIPNTKRQKKTVIPYTCGKRFIRQYDMEWPHRSVLYHYSSTSCSNQLVIQECSPLPTVFRRYISVELIRY